jgi:hypothetical protein
MHFISYPFLTHMQHHTISQLSSGTPAVTQTYVYVYINRIFIYRVYHDFRA